MRAVGNSGENGPARDDQSRGPFFRSLDHLDVITARLHRLGTIAFVSTVLNVIAVVATFATYNELWFGLSRTLVGVELWLALIALLAVAVFESTRKRGDVMFEEISDEVQWRVAQDRPQKGLEPSSHPDKRPSLEMRIALRSFASATDLPLIPGRYGPAAYAVGNVLLALTLISTLPS
jgi:hypothetical protein